MMFKKISGGLVKVKEKSVIREVIYALGGSFLIVYVIFVFTGGNLVVSFTTGFVPGMSWLYFHSSKRELYL